MSRVRGHSAFRSTANPLRRFAGVASSALVSRWSNTTLWIDAERARVTHPSAQRNSV